MSYGRTRKIRRSALKRSKRRKRIMILIFLILFIGVLASAAIVILSVP